MFAGPLLINKDAQEGTALEAVVVADARVPRISSILRDAGLEHGIARLQRIQHRALRDRAWVSEYDGQRHLGLGVRQGAEVEGEDDADHDLTKMDSGSSIAD